MKNFACTQCGGGLFVPCVKIPLDESERAIGTAASGGPVSIVTTPEAYSCENCGLRYVIDPQGNIERDRRSGKAKDL